MTEKDLIDLKEEIEDAKQKASEIKGQQAALLKRLKEEWGCKTVKDAEKLISDKEKEIEVMNEKIEIGLQELDSKFE